MTHKLQTLIWMAIAASISSVVLSVPFASAQITDSIRLWSTSPVSVKQSSSSLAICQDELSSRMGGMQIQVSLNDTSESIVSNAATRITGTGVQSRSDRGNSQNFSFSCVISSHDQQVSSLSYTFTGSTIFRNGSVSPSPSPLQYR